jgi:hypothetical protein
MTNYVTFQIESIPENATLIADVTAKLLGTPQGETIQPEPTVDPEPVEPTEPEPDPAEIAKAFKAFKKAAKAAVKEHSKQFLFDALVAHQADIDTSLLMTKLLAAVKPEFYSDISEILAEGPEKTPSPSLFDGNDIDAELEDEVEEVIVPTVSAIKLALKKMAKNGDRDGAIKLMVNHGAKGFKDIDTLKDDALIGLGASLKLSDDNE